MSSAHRHSYISSFYIPSYFIYIRWSWWISSMKNWCHRQFNKAVTKGPDYGAFTINHDRYITTMRHPLIFRWWNSEFEFYYFLFTTPTHVKLVIHRRSSEVFIYFFFFIFSLSAPRKQRLAHENAGIPVTLTLDGLQLRNFFLRSLFSVT